MYCLCVRYWHAILHLLCSPFCNSLVGFVTTAISPPYWVWTVANYQACVYEFHNKHVFTMLPDQASSLLTLKYVYVKLYHNLQWHCICLRVSIKIIILRAVEWISLILACKLQIGSKIFGALEEVQALAFWESCPSEWLIYPQLPPQLRLRWRQNEGLHLSVELPLHKQIESSFAWSFHEPD